MKSASYSCQTVQMSAINKKKHMIREVLQEALQVPSEDQRVVKVLSGRGNNLHEIEEAGGERYLVSMPSKFRRNIWIKRGDFILVEPIPEGDKVKGEIVLVLTPEHQKFYKANGCWPQEFESPIATASERDDDLFVNTNRPPVYEESESDSDSEESDSKTQEE